MPPDAPDRPPAVRAELRTLAAAVGTTPSQTGAALAAGARSRAVALGVPDTDAFWSALASSLEANVPLFLAHLGGDGATPRELPHETVEFARAAVRAGVAEDDLLQVLRIVQGPIWQRVMEILAQTPLSADAVTELQRFTGAYQDWFAGQLHAVQRRERDAGGDHRLALVGAVLGGGEVDGARLGYELDLEHLAVVAAGPQARETVLRLAESLGRHALIVGPEPTVAWGWLGGRRPLTEEQLRRLPAPGEVRVGVGDPAVGAEGFRRSHRQALAAHGHAGDAGGLVRYRDVALVDLLLRDTDAARALVERELGPLGGGERGERLRETLRAVFATGNGASAAPQLGVSARTVTHRIAEAEELLGYPLHERRAELELALRLEGALARQAAAT